MLKVRLDKISPYREIDYLQLMQALSIYANPHAKITQSLASGALIRVKKGLYVLGEEYNSMPIAMEVLANLIYGPSAISLDYALAHYGLIPEHVYTVTSITPQRDKIFTTPVGSFSYRYLAMKKYSIGLTRSSLKDGRHILMATPEKALIDKIYFSPCLLLQNKEDIENFLFNDLRVEESTLSTLNTNALLEIAAIYKNSPVSTVISYLLKR